MGGLFDSDPQTVTQEFKPPSYTRSGEGGSARWGWEDYINAISAPGGIAEWLFNPENSGSWEGGGLYDRDWNWALGQEPTQAIASRVANINPTQEMAIKAMNANLNNPIFGAQADQFLNNVMSGGYSGWDTMKDWKNEFGPMENKFGGETNPAFERMLDSARKNTEESFARSTAAQTDSAAAMAGAFGGSAHNELTAANAKALQDSLNQQEQTMRADQFNRAAGLEDTRLQRAFTGEENYYGRGERSWDRMAATGMQAAGMLPQFAQMRSGLAQAALGGGDALRTVDQDRLNALQAWKQGQLQRGLMPWDIFGSMLSRASGQGGTRLTETATPTNPWQMMMGLGLLGGSFLGK